MYAFLLPATLLIVTVAGSLLLLATTLYLRREHLDNREYDHGGAEWGYSGAASRCISLPHHPTPALPVGLHDNSSDQRTPGALCYYLSLRALCAAATSARDGLGT